MEIKTLHKKDRGIMVEKRDVFNFYIHMHSYYEMTLYSPFSGRIVINDITVTPNTFTAILVSPSDFHKTEVEAGENSPYIKISFDADIFSDEILPNTSMVIQDLEDDDYLKNTFYELFKNKDNEAYKTALLNTLIFIFKQKGRTLISSENAKRSGFGFDAVKIIHENITLSPTLSFVANKLNITPEYLSKSFKNDIGMTFSEYLTSLRLRRAEMLIAETDESITNICEMCGYGNFSHFIRSFKKQYGVSPSFYRKNK